MLCRRRIALATLILVFVFPKFVNNPSINFSLMHCRCEVNVWLLSEILDQIHSSFWRLVKSRICIAEVRPSRGRISAILILLIPFYPRWRLIFNALLALLCGWWWNKLSGSKFDGLSKVLIKLSVRHLLNAIRAVKELILRNHTPAAGLAWARYRPPVGRGLYLRIKSFTMVHSVWFKLRRWGWLVVRATWR